jgi:outer membrane immunogenic protein
MKRLLLGLAMLAAFVGSAVAADLPARTYTKAPPWLAPAYNWSGFYAGVNAGGGWGTTSWTFAVSPANYNHNIAGGMAGGQIGYNWQIDPSWLIGVEADGDWADIKGSTSCAAGIYVCSSEARALSSFRVRGGYVINTVLLYGTAGGAYADSHYSALINGAPGAGTGYFDSDRWGYAAGAGIEWGFAPNWSAKLEYMHYGFGAVTAQRPALGDGAPNLGLDIDTVKAGVNYHFNMGPLVARY